MTTPARIYVVTNRQSDAQRLVRAANQASAIRHVASSTFSAAVAAQETLVELVSEGVKVETAGDDLSEPPAL